MEDAADAILQSNDNHPKHSDSWPPGGTQPIVEIALRSLASPFKYPLSLVKFGAVPFLLSVSLEIIGNLFRTTGLVRSLGLFWVLLGLTVVYIPFDVGWTRLVIEGAPSVANRSLFPFGRTERYFLLAVFLFGCSWIILAIPVLVARSALRGFNHDLQVAAGLLLLWTFVAIVVVVVRLLLLFPAIATDRYRGLATAWKQTRGYFETLAVLYTVVRLPYLILIAVLDGRVKSYSPFTLKAAIITAQCVVYLLNEATVIAMIGLAYDHLLRTDQQI